MKLPKPLQGVARRPKHYLRWALLQTALVVTFSDLIAAFWPAFEALWRPATAHVGVALAAFAATLAEFITDEEDNKADA